MVVVVKPECRAVELVSAGFGDDIDNGTSAESIFRSKLVRDEPELGDDIRIVQPLVDPGCRHKVDVLPINHEVVGPDAHAVHRKDDAGIRVKYGTLAGLKRVDAG